MIRTTFLDPDYRKEPTTELFCCRCQKPIQPNSKYRFVHLIKGGYTVLHPDDEALYEPDSGDMGLFPIGMECSRIIGYEFTKEQQNADE